MRIQTVDHAAAAQPRDLESCGHAVGGGEWYRMCVRMLDRGNGFISPYCTMKWLIYNSKPWRGINSNRHLIENKKYGYVVAFKVILKYHTVCPGIANLAWHTRKLVLLAAWRNVWSKSSRSLWVWIDASTISFMGSIRLANPAAFNIPVGNRLKWDLRYMLLRDNSFVIILNNLYSAM